MEYVLEFEKPVSALENQIKELRQASTRPNIDLTHEINALQEKVNLLIQDIYSNLGPWERVQLSRHPLRPHSIDYIQGVFEDFHELSGDRQFGDDGAIIGGLAKFSNHPVMVIGIEKGRKTKEKVQRNFGMPRPEGYRKALRLMKLADQFKIPIITFVDTPGAYPGIDAEERGQSQAISENIAQMFDLQCPISTIIIGEGGSGGALGIAVADDVMMMEYSIYSVISPESCASILWSDSKMGEKASSALKLDPHSAKDLGVIDDIIIEPIGGAHRHSESAIAMVKKYLDQKLPLLWSQSPQSRLDKRFEKFRRMGNQTISNLSSNKN